MILLVSGGIDSFIAAKYLEQNRYSARYLYIDYHGKYTKKELKICKNLYPTLEVNTSLNFKGMEQGEKAFIKNRNAYFALIGSNYGKTIVIAGLKDDNVGDKSREAFIQMQNLLSEINGEDYAVISPFWRKTKSDIIKWYIENNFNIMDLLQTTSCYHSTETYCGRCPSCFRKWCAFNDNEIASYLPEFKNIELVQQYVKNVSNYDKERQGSILRAASNLGVI